MFEGEIEGDRSTRSVERLKDFLLSHWSVEGLTQMVSKDILS
jgi:hypothetical protein